MGKAFDKFNILRTLTLLFAILLLFTVVLMPAYATETSGEVDGIKWAVNGGVLSIEGKGKMPDFTEQDPAPWAEFARTVTHLSIDSRITSIGDLAFYDFGLLLAVSLSKNVETVGDMAFAGCEKLASVSMPAVTRIGEYAFSRCFALESVILPTTLTELGGNAFYRCESLYAVTVPASVTTMGGSVFAYCKSLVSATVNAQITQLPEWTFYGCEKLGTLVLAPTVTDIGDSAFTRCDVLTFVYHNGDEEVAEQFKENISDNVDNIYDISITPGTEEVPPAKDLVFVQDGDRYISTDTTIDTKENSVIKTDTVITYPATESGYDEKAQDAEIKISATIVKDDGWDDLFTRLDTEYANRGALEGQTDTDVPINVNVSLLDGSYIYGKTLKKLANKRVTVTVTTPNGSSWKIDGTQLAGHSFKTKYNLDYTLTSYQKLSKSHRATLAGAVAYKLTTSDKMDFPIMLLLYIDKTLTNSNATLYDIGFGGSLKQIKTVALSDGTAEYKMANVNKGARYIVALNLISVTPEQVHRPDTNAPDLENYVPVTQQYEITEVRGFMGMTMKQFTIAVVCAIAALAFVVFIIVLMVNLLAKKKAIDTVRNNKKAE